MMDAQFIGLAAGMLLSLVFNYLPGLSKWYEPLEADAKRFIMLGALALVTAGGIGLSCSGIYVLFACDKPSLTKVIEQFILALIANQGTYLISPKPAAVRALLGRLNPKLFLLFLILPLLFVSPAIARAEAPGADTFPGDEVYCLAATVHTEAASQSPAAKAGVARWVLVRAIQRQQTICASLRSERTIAAAHAPEGSWAWQVYHHGDLLQRARGRESYRIATEVYDTAGIGAQYDHFDSCDTRAGWALHYTRVQLEAGDSVCFWAKPGLQSTAAVPPIALRIAGAPSTVANLSLLE